jgi:hypothetical protein
MGIPEALPHPTASRPRPAADPFAPPPPPFAATAAPLFAMDAQEPETPFAAVTAQTSRLGRVRRFLRARARAQKCDDQKN